MLMLSGFVLIGLAALAGYRRGINCSPLAQWKMIVLHTLLLLNAIFLGFGPGGAVRVNMMALHLYLQVAIGIFYILTGHVRFLFFLLVFPGLVCFVFYFIDDGVLLAHLLFICSFFFFLSLPVHTVCHSEAVFFVVFLHFVLPDGQSSHSGLLF